MKEARHKRAYIACFIPMKGTGKSTRQRVDQCLQKAEGEGKEE